MGCKFFLGSYGNGINCVAAWRNHNAAACTEEWRARLEPRAKSINLLHEVFLRFLLSSEPVRVLALC